jgi:hypothetical protein
MQVSGTAYALSRENLQTFEPSFACVENCRALCTVRCFRVTFKVMGLVATT